jgi:hypothetical protein
MQNEKISQTPQEKKTNVLLAMTPHMLAFPLTIFLCYNALKSSFLLDYLNISLPHEFNFENKISILARIASWISLVLIFNLFTVIGARVYSKAANPLKDQNNELVTVTNKILTNSVEQTMIFLPLLVNWVINCSSTEADLKQGVSLAIIWVAGRILFSIGYFLGYLRNFTVLRVFGFAPTLFPSVILASRLAGIKI